MSSGWVRLSQWWQKFRGACHPWIISPAVSIATHTRIIERNASLVICFEVRNVG
ncbi:MAG: hypothetical protein F6K34_08630 [Okeania sp. SIO4D6]|nr:hypothetical protein [Okeania sp. SIO4D6]